MTATVISGATVLDGQTIDIRAAKVATGLAAMSIGAGDAVAIFLRNDPVFFEISMGAALLGAYVVPINWHFRRDEALYVISDSGSKLVIAHEDLLPILGDMDLPDVALLECPVPPEVELAYGSTASGQDRWSAWRTR